jgi:hypothetical protein
VQPYSEQPTLQQQNDVHGCSSRSTSVGKKTKLGNRHGLHVNGRRTTRILIAIVAGFVVCWSPWSVLSLIVELDKSAVAGNNFELIDVILKIFALTGSACVNPVFYCWLNDNFRSELGSAIAVRLKVFAPAAAENEVRRSSRRDRGRRRSRQPEDVGDGFGRRPAAAMITNVVPTRNETRAVVATAGVSVSGQFIACNGVPRLLIYKASLMDVEQEGQCVDQTMADSEIFDRPTLTQCDQLSWCCPADDADVDNVSTDMITGLRELQLPPQHQRRRRSSFRR